jgi:hypothetical protein
MATKKEQAFIKKHGRKPATDMEMKQVFGGNGDPEPVKKRIKKRK